MKALVVLNGDCPSPEFLRHLSTGRALIAADGGYAHYINAGISPCVLVGDMDSIEDIPPGVEIIRYDPEKDRTDGQLAIEAAIERGADEIVLTCALSRDMGHVMENIRMMLFSPVPISIEEPEMSILLVRTGESAGIPEGKKVSIVPLGESAELEIRGFRYEHHGILRETSGISNISGKDAEIRMINGAVAVFLHR